MDPAKPWFDVSAASNTIRKDDAQLVDVMHTNSGFLLNVRKLFYQKLDKFQIFEKKNHFREDYQFLTPLDISTTILMEDSIKKAAMILYVWVPIVCP